MPPSTGLLTGDLAQVIGYLSAHPEERYDPADPCGCVLHHLLRSLGAPEPLISYSDYYPDTNVGPLEGGNYPMPEALGALQRHWVHYAGSSDTGLLDAEAALTVAINQMDGILTSDPAEAEAEYGGDGEEYGRPRR